ncbi:MAG: hypothetical protein AAF652_20800, partial [Cyanobacteria bacterium P01_C01_bin.72]
MFSYYAYGLEIHSEMEIPEFIPSAKTAKCDVKLTIDRTASLSSYLSAEALEYPWALNLTREKALVYLQDLGIFSIKDGKTIVFIPAPQALEQPARFYIVGTVMAILLYQRGFLVLH